MHEGFDVVKFVVLTVGSGSLTSLRRGVFTAGGRSVAAAAALDAARPSHPVAAVTLVADEAMLPQRERTVIARGSRPDGPGPGWRPGPAECRE